MTHVIAETLAETHFQRLKGDDKSHDDDGASRYRSMKRNVQVVRPAWITACVGVELCTCSLLMILATQLKAGELLSCSEFLLERTSLDIGQVAIFKAGSPHSPDSRAQSRRS